MTTSKFVSIFLSVTLLLSACKHDSDNPVPGNIPLEGVGVTTIAGGATAGFADGTGDAAKFNDPSGVVSDASGNLYVADLRNNRIRKISPAGNVTNFAGNGNAGFADGAGNSAMFNGPSKIAIDQNGNLYVTDYFNNRIRKVTPSGMVSTIAGSGALGYQDGNAASAKFNQPSNITVDPSGNVYVSDDNRIRKIHTNGMVSTIAGSGAEGHLDGAAATAQFEDPDGLAMDKAGNLFVADGFNHSIRKISPAGVVSTFAGSGKYGYADGNGSAAKFDLPSGLTIDAYGNLYVADFGSGHIRKITPAGLVSTLAGTGAEGYSDGPLASAGMYRASNVTLDPAGNIYVTNFKYHGIRKITLSR